MQGYVTSSVVGGRDGYIFNDVDVFAMDQGGDFVIDDYKKNAMLDKQHPIRSISVSNGWVVDGIAVEYQNSKGESVTLSHGSQFSDRKQVKFQANEILVGVFGRAGRQGFYARELVNKIGFVICNLNTGDIRIAGPYGPPANASNRNDGEAFYVSDVVAFGGFTKHTADLGLSGLFFFKDLSRPIMMDIGRLGLYSLTTNAEALQNNVEEEDAIAEKLEATRLEDGSSNGDLKDVDKAVTNDKAINNKAVNNKAVNNKA